MGRSKKNKTAKSEEAVVVDVQVEEGVAASEPIAEQEAQPSSEIEEIEEAPKAEKAEKTVEAPTVKEPVKDISPRDLELMRLYPQYEKIWITPKGFVHPEGAPQFLLKGAKLFKNKFFNNKI